MKTILTIIALIISTGCVCARPEVTSRYPASSSVPCPHKLSEETFDIKTTATRPATDAPGDPAVYIHREMMLSCRSSDKQADWIIHAVVICDKNDPFRLTKNFCETGIGEPVDRFFSMTNADKVHDYYLGRYVVGKECKLLEIPGFRKDIKTGELSGVEVQPLGWLCNRLEYSDGLSQTIEKTVAKDWKFTHVWTMGAPAEEDEALGEQNLPSIFGVEPYMYKFKLSIQNGKVTWGEN